MEGYDHILPKYDLFFMSVIGEIPKIRLFQTVVFAKNLESAIFTNEKQGRPTLHSLTPKHVLAMSAKLKFQCERFEKKQCFALMVLNWFPIRFYQDLFRRCDVYHTILLVSIILKLKK